MAVIAAAASASWLYPSSPWDIVAAPFAAPGEEGLLLGSDSLGRDVAAGIVHGTRVSLMIGVASTAGQWIVVLAYRYADASVLAPFSYVQLMWVSILGFIVFGEVPDVWTIAGAAFIVASGLYIAHRERVRRSQLLATAAEPSPNA